MKPYINAIKKQTEARAFSINNQYSRKRKFLLNCFLSIHERSEAKLDDCHFNFNKRMVILSLKIWSFKQTIGVVTTYSCFIQIYENSIFFYTVTSIYLRVL